MNLHKSEQKPDWRVTPSSRWNGWQRLANSTNGIATPGNLATAMGLGLVIWGLVLVGSGDYFTGALLLAGGRLFDLLDGYLANATKTKSPLGEIIDTATDKLEIFLALVLLLYIQAVPSGVVLTILIFSVWIFGAALAAWLKKYRLHPSLSGKLATAAAWASLIIFIFDYALSQPNGYLLFFGYLFFGAFLATGFFAAFGYSRAAFSDVAGAKNLLASFENIMAVYNPSSSNRSRAKARIIEIEELSGQKVEIIKTDKNKTNFTKKLQDKLIKSAKPTLLLLGGGDGTVHDTLNIVLNIESSKVRNNIVVMPLWSGNANDFAFMLNGLSFNKRLVSVFSGGQIISFKPLQINIKTPKDDKIFYAICYASFGAIAYVAKELDKKSATSKGLLSSIPVVVMWREILSVIGAFRQAPTFKAEVEGKRVKIFEEAFTKGSRIAKINTVPIKLTDNAYFHINQTEEHPLLSRRVVQIITRRKFGEILDKPTEISLRNSTLAQFDGEVHKIPRNTKISVMLSPKKIKAISIKLK